MVKDKRKKTNLTQSSQRKHKGKKKKRKEEKRYLATDLHRLNTDEKTKKKTKEIFS